MGPQDYSKDLTVVITGSGDSNQDNIIGLLEEFVFGTLDEREITFIVPYMGMADGKMPKGMTKVLNYLTDSEHDFIAVVGNEGHSSISKAMQTVPVQRDGVTPDYDGTFYMETALGLLTDAHKDGTNKNHEDLGHETAFFMLYDPENPADLHAIQAAKNYPWLRTLNLSEGLVDSFENYESTDDQIKREAAEKKFAEEEAARKAAEPVADKPAPRKRAAKKVAAKPLKAGDTPLTERLDNLVDESVKREESRRTSVPVGTQIEVAGIGFTKKAEDPFDDNSSADKLTPAKITNKQLDALEDVWSDVAKAVPSTGTIMVKKADLAELTENVQQMATAFAGVVGSLTKIMGE